MPDDVKRSSSATSACQPANSISTVSATRLVSVRWVMALWLVQRLGFRERADNLGAQQLVPQLATDSLDGPYAIMSQCSRVELRLTA